MCVTRPRRMRRSYAGLGRWDFGASLPTGIIFMISRGILLGLRAKPVAALAFRAPRASSASPGVRHGVLPQKSIPK